MRQKMRQAKMVIEIDKRPTQRDVEKFRGYIAGLEQHEVLLHQHEEESFRYKAPLIQYKLIENKLSLIGYEEGIEIIERLYPKLQQIKLREAEYEITSKTINVTKLVFEPTTILNKYKITTPWLAINQENYKKYKEGQFDLNKQMQNNLLANFKDLGIRLSEQIMCHGTYEPVKVVLKDTQLIGFLGDFVCNLEIPDYMGVGKRKSIGYGTIEKVKD